MRAVKAKMLNREAARLSKQEGWDKKGYKQIAKELKYIHIHRNNPFSGFDIKEAIKSVLRKERRVEQRERNKRAGLKRRNGNNWSWVSKNSKATA